MSLTESNKDVVNNSQESNTMAGKKAAATQSNPIEKAAKTVNRTLKMIHRIGTLKELKSEHISKIETALSEQTKAAISKLRNPKVVKEDGFTL